MAMVNALNSRDAGLEIERAAGAHGNASDMPPLVTAAWDDRADEIAGPKAMHRFVAHEPTTRKSMCGDPRPLVRPAARCCDGERRDPPS